MFSDVDKTLDIVYGRAVNSRGVLQDLKLDLFEPAGDTEDFRPVYVWAHGGAFVSGDKAANAAMREDLARRGWVTISIQYRLHHDMGAGFMGILTADDPKAATEKRMATVRDAQRDIQAAIRWVRANAARYRLDSSRIAAGGFSAGAEVALTVAFNDDDAADVAFTSDRPFETGNAAYPSSVSAAVSHAGVYAPGTHGVINAGEPPVAMLHGTSDPTVPFPSVIPSCAVTQALLNICELTPFPGSGHSVLGTDVARDFLYRYVVAADRTPTTLTLDPVPSSGQITDHVPVRATLSSEGLPLGDRKVVFALGSEQVAVVTGPDGVAEATLTPVAPAGTSELSVTFSGEETSPVGALGSGSGYAGSRDARSFDVRREATALTYEGDRRIRGETVDAVARLLEDDGPPIAGVPVTFAINGVQATATTNDEGLATATLSVPDHGKSRELLVNYPGDDTYEPAQISTTVTWGGSPQ